jgi:hypothetical protein
MLHLTDLSELKNLFSFVKHDSGTSTPDVVVQLESDMLRWGFFNHNLVAAVVGKASNMKSFGAVQHLGVGQFI